ncbi:MAG: glutaredoxin family protein [Gammaproteobacteria bacterium]
MKKIILIAVVASVIYGFKPDLLSSLFTSGAFDEDGKPVVWLFTTNNCGAYCSDVVNLFKKRNIDYTEFDANSEEGKERLSEVGGKNRFPLTVVGSRSVVGNDKLGIISLLAEDIGEEILTRSEQQVMSNHFYEGGEPMIIMYGTSWCGFCKKMRNYLNENSIDFTEYDAEGPGRQAYNILEGNGYPLMYVGYRRINGADINKLEKAMSDLDF